MSTASIWYLLACSCAAADSTVRLVSPKTSGVYDTLSWGVIRV
jgi:hypothetical protein